MLRHLELTGNPERIPPLLVFGPFGWCHVC
jgi:hypothetical protein